MLSKVTTKNICDIFSSIALHLMLTKMFFKKNLEMAVNIRNCTIQNNTIIIQYGVLKYILILPTCIY